uniref:Uncharacterized protein n=1 Tax=Moorena producens (strain JHB) TaxID=1454205 RepID=A0A1D9G273_MOOP1
MSKKRFAIILCSGNLLRPNFIIPNLFNSDNLTRIDLIIKGTKSKKKMKNNQTNQTPQPNSGANSESINGKNSTKLSKLSVSELERISGGKIIIGAPK